MATTGKGLFDGGTSGILYTDRQNFYISPQTYSELWPSVNPFLANIIGREQRNPPDPTFKLFEHRAPWRKQRVVNNATTPTVSADTGQNIDIDGILGLASTADDSYVGLKFEVWDTTELTRKGVVVVTDVVDGDTLTVKNLGSTAITFVDNDVLYVVGNAKGEGDTAKQGWADELQVVWNQCGIMETVVELERTIIKAALRGEMNEMMRLIMDKAKEHKMQMEKDILFSDSPLGTNMNHSETFATNYGNTRTDARGKKIRSTLGAITAVLKYGSSTTTDDDQNIFTINESSYSYANFVDDMEKVFRYLPEAGYKNAYCGRTMVSFWSKLAESGFAANSGWKVLLTSKETSLGYKIFELVTPHGILNIIPTPAFDGPWKKYMFIPSEEDLFNVVYDADKYETNIKTDDAYDGRKDRYFSDRGIGMTLLEKHKLFKLV